MRRAVAALWHDRCGAAAVEFALLAPAFLMMLVGTVMMAMMFFTNSSLHYAVEAAARCASVKATVCTNAATTQAFAASNYFGATATPTFTCTGRVCGGSASCGNKVTGQISYTLEVGMARYVTPLRADACYP
jgi:Flp pilus assembly protein TadG